MNTRLLAYYQTSQDDDEREDKTYIPVVSMLLYAQAAAGPE